MIFLKKFHADGFKSFAKPVTLNFNSTMIGIVGPNGSGKSNIVDALKWAIGGQSIKDLRGKDKSNLIFAGSNDLKEADYALVELTFDNTNKILHSDSEEVKISRKLVKKTGENIYMLNDQPCLLKDILNIFIDTGLNKGSLSIISQGSVNWFAEAKPEDRRTMFESAAGIGKYIKQKEEATKHLESATNNLDRLSHTLSLYKKEIKELNRQAEKAQLYKEKKEKLTRYDVSVSVQDYLSWKDELIEVDSKYEKQVNELSQLEIELDKHRMLKSQFENEYQVADSKTRDLIKVKEDLEKQINSLSTTKATYIANLENNIHSSNLQERKESYKSLIATEEAILSSYKKQLGQMQNEKMINDQSFDKLSNEKASVEDEFKDINQDFFRKRHEYEQLERQSNSVNSHDRGVNELLKVKNRIPGIHSTIQNLIKVKERYEVAIQTALGKSVSNLVVDSDETALKAINYLKQNNCGRATFLPLNTIKGKEIASSSLTIMTQMPGFIDVASNIVSYDPQYKDAISSILGNVGIADTVENANHISKMIKSNYKIISLDGDVIFAGGAIAGGQKTYNNTVLFNLEEKLIKAKEAYNESLEKFKAIEVRKNQIDHEFKQLNIKKQMSDSSLQILERNIVASEEKLEKYKNDLIALDITDDELKNKTKLADFEGKLIELNEQLINIKKEYEESEQLRQLSYDQLAKYSSEYNNIQDQQNELIKSNGELSSKKVNLENKILNTEDRIANSYGLTMDVAIENYNKPLEVTIAEAKRIIATLRAEMDSLGNINFEALGTLEEKEKEYKKLESETNDARDSVNSLTQLILNLDKRAKEDFVGVIDRVNAIIPSIFKSLFGGGHCEIRIVDPTNVLESGIDVIAQPPGKKVTNLVLFSGGEKTLIALAVLFAILKSSHFPLVLLDEAEAALDQANVNTFAKLIQDFSDGCQFLVITHRTGTMKMCDVLYGTMMKVKGVTNIIKTSFDLVKNNTFEVEKDEK